MIVLFAVISAYLDGMQLRLARDAKLDCRHCSGRTARHIVGEIRSIVLKLVRFSKLIEGSSARDIHSRCGREEKVSRGDLEKYLQVSCMQGSFTRRVQGQEMSGWVVVMSCQGSSYSTHQVDDICNSYTT
jgi:hypothetical protein